MAFFPSLKTFRDFRETGPGHADVNAHNRASRFRAEGVFQTRSCVPPAHLPLSGKKDCTAHSLLTQVRKVYRNIR